LPLDGHTRYRIGAFELTDPNFEALYCELTGQIITPKPSLGDVVKLRAGESPTIAKPLSKKDAVTDFAVDGNVLDRSVSRGPRQTEVALAVTTVPIIGVPAKPDNYSIWASVGNILTHNDAFGGARRNKVAIPDVPRAYMRVIPGGWKNSIPSISDIAKLDQSERVDAPSDGVHHGDFGATEEGFVRYWITDWSDGREASSTNVTMFFENTGEFWMLHGRAVAQERDQLLLADRGMLKHWSRMLRTAMAVLGRFRAKEIRRVEAGLFGVKDVRWISEWQGDRTPSRQNDIREIQQAEDWSLAAQLTFLTNAYNRVRNLFALAQLSEAEVTQILQQFDPERFQTRA
jgi:hypothetical protein